MKRLRRPIRSILLGTALCCGMPTPAAEPPRPRWEPAYKIKPQETGRLVGGEGVPLVEDGNALFPYRDDAPRPEPEVPSIFEWQREQRSR